jgi:hypothetical protein
MLSILRKNYIQEIRSIHVRLNRFRYADHYILEYKCINGHLSNKQKYDTTSFSSLHMFPNYIFLHSV